MSVSFFPVRTRIHFCCRTPGLVSPDLSSLRSMDLSELVLNPERSLRGVVCCYVPYILNLTLQWVCSQCSCIFKQGRCTRHFPPCQSDVGIFSASARMVVDDGSARANALCLNEHVRTLLSLGQREWAELQSLVERRGSVRLECCGREQQPAVSEIPVGRDA
nr:PREDICTED: CST complex subunit CTC1-like [Latimeria chalumnae]|eukprot:XP_006011900.2 PREDICTED: CST complex subunit CTC1-like [Latimeria chalumnae]